jgi:hypothetical protein
VRKFILLFINPAKSWIPDASGKTKLTAISLFLVGAVLLINALHSPTGPYPLLYLSIEIYLILVLAYTFGTVLPALLATFFHIEDFPLAPGGKLGKAFDFLLMLFLAYGVSTVTVRGIQYILQVQPGSGFYTIFNLIEPCYFLYLICSMSTTVFNIGLKKSSIAVVPFVFTFLIFYFEITAVHSWAIARSGGNYYAEISAVEFLLLFTLALAPALILAVTQLKKRGIREMKEDEAFHVVPEPEEMIPGEAFEQAMMMIKLGKRDKAMEYLNASAKTKAPRTELFLERAKIYYSLKKHEEAAADLEAYLEAKPKGVSEEPHLFLIECYKELGEWENVLDVSEELLEKYESNLRALYYNLLSKYKLGESVSAEETMTRLDDTWKDIPKFRRKDEKKWYEKIRQLLTQPPSGNKK